MDELMFALYVGHIEVTRKHYNLLGEYNRPIVGIVEKALAHWLEEFEEDLRQSK